MPGALETDTGKAIPSLRLTAAMLKDRSLVIYGPSGTGKTVVTLNMMKMLQGHIEQVIVISPSEPTNRSYEGTVAPPLLHYRLFLPDPGNPKKDDGRKGALRFLEATLQRQEMMGAIYSRANNADALASLYTRLPSDVRREGVALIQDINEKRAGVVRRLRHRFEDDPGVLAAKTKEVNEKFRQMLALIYKKYLTPHYQALWERSDLSEDERYCLAYMHFNPRLLLVFDDCAAMLKPFFNSEIFRTLFYRGRHSYITSIFSVQDDTDVPANLRKNAFISFFTEPVVARSNFTRASNQFNKETKNYVEEIIPTVFKGFRRLAYIREDPARQHFYYYEAGVPAPFRFGAPAMWELCDMVKSAGTSMDKENPYYEMFRLS